MKKTLNIAFVSIFVFMLISCGKDKKTVEKEPEAKSYSIDAEHSTVQWTAYKTTDKLPVKGTFKEIEILKMNDGATPSSALDGLDFEIPVASIFSKDTIRDAKLNKFFFAVMENTLTLKGLFTVENENKGNLVLTMNGLTKNLPFTYTMSQDTILVNAKMDLNAWEAQDAVASLHEACLALHTGPDGVSKTWDEVGISAKILTVKN